MNNLPSEDRKLIVDFSTYLKIKILWMKINFQKHKI